MTSGPPVAGSTAASVRLRSLDGLRGVAALVVVVHHALQLIPAFAETQAAVSR